MPASTATPTTAPTLTPTPSPTRTSAPTMTASPTQTPSPAATSTPTPSPTAASSPTPTPSLSSALGARLDAALHRQQNGEYNQATTAYLDLLSTDLDAEQIREVRYRLAETYLLQREYAASAAAWNEYLASYPNDERAPQAHFMAARAYQGADRCDLAITHYQQYLSRSLVLADLAYESQGDCLTILTEEAPDRGALMNEAIAAYQHALESGPDRTRRISLRAKIADRFRAQDDPQAAVEQYDAILKDVRTASERAKYQYLAGQTLATAGQVPSAHERYRRAMDSAPRAEHAYLSLTELVDAGVEVDLLQQAMVYYWAGATYPAAYEAAIRAFDRYLVPKPGPEAGQALYYKALAQRALEQPQAAVATLDQLLIDYPQSEFLPRAWLAKGTTLGRMGDTDAAVRTYQELAQRFPASEQAPRALWQAAQLREGENAFAEAANLFEQMQATFPGHQDAAEALWYAGLSYYRSGDPGSAAATWQALLNAYPRSSYAAKSLYWLGKVGTMLESDEGPSYWDQLVTSRPANYYALRVAQVRAGDSLTTTRLITAAIEPPAWNPSQAQDTILAWLRDWEAVPDGTQLIPLPDDLARRPNVRRGESLLAVGLRRQALDTLDRVRAAAWEDPVALAQLALYFREQGMAGLAARSAYRLAALWPAGSIAQAPVALQQIAYPLAYADLLSREARARNLDPLLLAALIRQESLFEPVAESYAGARGLGQVMPATGKGLARNLGLEGFDLDDLYRPAISVRFAAYYLEIQMGRFDHNLLIALAAYNGGPGNTLRWLEGAGDDLDLFVELITANQSRVYLQRVYSQYLIYERLYRPSESEQQPEGGGD